MTASPLYPLSILGLLGTFIVGFQPFGFKNSKKEQSSITPNDNKASRTQNEGHQTYQTQHLTPSANNHQSLNPAPNETSTQTIIPSQGQLPAQDNSQKTPDKTPSHSPSESIPPMTSTDQTPRPNTDLAIVSKNCSNAFERVKKMTVPQLESTHDYIQWLFPFSKGGMNFPESEIPADVLREIKSSKGNSLRQIQREAFSDLMKRHFGLELVDDTPGFKTLLSVQNPIGNTWDQTMATANHNDLRISRILQSLNEIGNPDLATALFEFVKSKYANNSARQTALNHWTTAYNRSKRSI